MILLFSIFSTIVQAGNLDPSSMGNWSGKDYTAQDQIQQGFNIVSKQLGMAIANHPHAPSSMGIHGFEMSLENNIAFIDAKDYLDGSPSPWNLAFSDEDAPQSLWLPTVNVTKGLPLSFEVGLRTGVIPHDTGSLFGSYLRFSPVEGYHKAPDITVQVGYSGYIGNSEMAVGTMDTSIAIGKSIPFGPLTGVNSSVMRPYIAAGMYKMRVDPRLTEKETESLGLTPISSFKNADNFNGEFKSMEVGGGIEFESNEILFALSANYALGNVLSIQHTFGFSF